MPPFQNYRKRRPGQGPNKNELKVSRSQNAEKQKVRAGNLGERFPQVSHLTIEYRMETSSGAELEQARKEINPTDSMLLDVTCQGGCGNGVFLLQDAVEALIQTNNEVREGMALCQGVSYNDAKLPCGTKLLFRIQASY